MKTQVEMIAEVLQLRYDCPSNSAITEALAQCIFGGHFKTLARYADKWQDFQAAVTPAMVREAMAVINGRMRELAATLDKMEFPPQWSPTPLCGGDTPLIPGSRYCL